MDASLFLEKMVDILDAEDELSMDMDLSEIEEWDSLGVLTFLAEMEPLSANPITADSVKAAKTIAELYALVK